MDYNIELNNYYERYGNLILISLCTNYHDYFNNSSVFFKYIAPYDFDRVIQHICSTLIQKGKIKLYYSIINKKNDKKIHFYEKKIDNNGSYIYLRLPKEIMTWNTRKSIIKNFNILNSNKLLKVGRKNIEDAKYLNEMKKEAKLALTKKCKGIYIDDYDYYEYFNDYYYTYKKIKMLLFQRALVDYVISEINFTFENILKFKKKDYIIFNGLNQLKLKSLLENLEKGTKTISDILDEIFKR